jgi:hypothetical protein
MKIIDGDRLAVTLEGFTHLSVTRAPNAAYLRIQDATERCLVAIFTGAQVADLEKVIKTPLVNPEVTKRERKLRRRHAECRGSKRLAKAK